MQPDSKTRVRFFRRGDVLLAAAVLVLAGGLLLGRRLLAKPGANAVITTPTETRTLPLNADATCTLRGRDDRLVVIAVENGRARFVSSDCPDHVCVNSGWLSQAGQSAACLPAGVVLRITGDGGVDAVTG